MAQNYHAEHYEIVFIDNDSTDGTKELLLYYADHYPRVRTIINPVRGIAGSRNLGLVHAKYNFVAYTDSDCVVPKDWLTKLVSGFEKYFKEEPNLVAVGGSNIPPQGSGLLYNTLHIFLNTFLGSHGSVQGKRFSRDRFVNHLPTVNVMYQKQKVLNVGGFDVTFGNIGEDQDLSYRLEKQGYTFVYLADTAVVHKLRPTLKAWFRNMRLYGKGRMWLMRKHPDKIDVVLFAPMLLVASMPLALLSSVHFIFLVPLLYFPFMFITSAVECQKSQKLRYTVPLFVLYFTSHIAYGLSLIHI